MKSELGLLTQNQKESLFALLSSCDEQILLDFDTIPDAETKFFVLSKCHLLKTYTFLISITSNDRLKSQIKRLLNQASLSKYNMIMVTFVGLGHERVTVFSDLNFKELFGLVGNHLS